MLNKLINLYSYWKNPKYRLMKGIKIGNRSIMFIGANPIEPRDTTKELKIHGYIDEKHQNRKISFKNQTETYWKSNKVKAIWNFKELMYFRRIIGTGYKCLEYRKGKWRSIEK